ncbi:MAG: hypothetical protein ABH864_03540 [archaeon]
MSRTQLNEAVEMYDEPVYRSPSGKPTMALAVDKRSVGTVQPIGLVREIVKRVGDVETAGYVDRSRLVVVKGSEDGLHWEMDNELKMGGLEDEIVGRIQPRNTEFIGPEDPDIFIEGGTTHVYFTIPFLSNDGKGSSIHLGHAQGVGLDSLRATNLVLSPINRNRLDSPGYKEVSILPATCNRTRIALCESSDTDHARNVGVSTIVSARFNDMGEGWAVLGTVANPANLGIEWCGEHLSPGPIFDPTMASFKGYFVGIANGRSPSRDGVYGRFTAGLMLIDPRTGKIPWISPKPLVDDPKARTITFASDFVRTGEREGILYAHVDDSFVRAYNIDLSKLAYRMPSKDF